jgi:2,4-dienoyl-CoA reductase-like NADH-dependent reductase (Old Yellow Enzyme family)
MTEASLSFQEFETMRKRITTSILFTPIKIGQVTVSNRFVRSATHDFLADEDGKVTDRQVVLLRDLAEGEVGLIITGHAYVNPAGKASPRQIAVYDDRFIEGLARIPGAVHDFASRVFLQIAHAGRQTKPKLCGCTPLSPSAVYDPSSKTMPKEMTGEEIRGLIEDFIQAARRAKEAGFDGAQLHVAHGYLLSSFISPHTNRRRDEWGGSITNRARVLAEIVRGTKDLLGPEFSLIVKLNCTDFLPAGLTIEESIQVAKILESAGIDAIEVSGGMAEAGKGSIWPGLRREDEEGYFVDQAAGIKEAVKVPVFGLGGIRSFSVMEKIVREGRADLISMSRPFIREPFLVRKLRQGEIQKSECISCVKCFNLRGIRCAELQPKKAVSE